jgi:hypothetical protein
MFLVQFIIRLNNKVLITTVHHCIHKSMKFYQSCFKAMMDPGQSIILQSPYFKFFSKKRPYDGVEGPKIKGTWVAAHFALHLAIPC